MSSDLFYADLHIHTTASDGLLTPTEIVREAAVAGVRCLAVTDHDTVAGLGEAANEAKLIGLEFVPGIEVSAWRHGREIHVLGYDVDAESAVWPDYERRMMDMRRERAYEMVDRLQSLGKDLQHSDLDRIVGDAMPGRPHVARALVEKGLIASMHDAFAAYLGDGRPADVPKKAVDYRDVIDMIHRAGGIAVLAHPAHRFTDYDLSELRGHGLDGVEVVHPSHPPDLTEYYANAARRHGLIPTGGSDYHGSAGGQVPTIGSFGVAEDVVKEIRQRAAAYRAPSHN